MPIIFDLFQIDNYHKIEKKKFYDRKSSLILNWLIIIMHVIIGGVSILREQSLIVDTFRIYIFFPKLDLTFGFSQVV